jgi:VanZ family protein
LRVEAPGPEPSTLELPLDGPPVRRSRIGAIAWGILLFTFTSWPSPPRLPLVAGIPDSDKVGHFALYAVEAWLLYRSVRWPGKPRFSPARALAIVGAMAIWGVADELHQKWIPGRSMEGGDVAADVAGAAAGALAASGVSRKRGAGADPSLRSG